MSAAYALLVVAKAPVAGFAKTRLCPPATPEQAADLAAAALLDTLDAILDAREALPLVAFTGDIATAARSAELEHALSHCTVFPQRGHDFATRLVNAHADTAALAPGLPVVQIGMDTPQVTTTLLRDVARGLDGNDAVHGPAADGGWWALGLRDPLRASVLADVPMSRPDTGTRTEAALRAAGLRTGATAMLTDVDTIADADAVAGEVPSGRFASALRASRRHRAVAR